jgi:hypothetical protein
MRAAALDPAASGTGCDDQACEFARPVFFDGGSHCGGRLSGADDDRPAIRAGWQITWNQLVSLSGFDRLIEQGF